MVPFTIKRTRILFHSLSGVEQASDFSRRSFRRLLLFLFASGMAFCAGAPARAALAPSQVLILVNKDTKISSDVARMYQKLRGIPAANVLSLSLGTSREITREQYRTRLAAPVKKYLEAHPKIRCIVTTSGVPYTLASTTREGAALDNELATVLGGPGHGDRAPNPLFLDGRNAYGITDPRELKMVYVARLDGPDLKIITRMVKDAIATEKAGLQGPVFGDARGIDSITGYGLGDASIRQAIDLLSGAGFPATLDLKEATWTQPKGGVGNQAAGAAFYIGWYKLRNFQDIFGKQGLARGAIAWHIAGGEAVNIWDAGEKGWCVNLLRRGAAVTLGPVREPYVAAFPRGDIFVESLLAGATVAESYWLALPNVSWNMVLLGDPLYRPFAHKPKPSLVARAYISGSPGHVLQPGKKSALLVELECLGPAGSATPTMKATAEPGVGLAAASGSVTIPPLRAGQRTVVRIPSVTPGSDPTGLFRLRLSVQTAGEKSRRIVLEGRIGFSRLTAGMLPKRQMFTSPDGEYLIAGEPGRSTLIETETLRSHPIILPKGVALFRADFAPDSEHVVLTLANPREKKVAFVITDNRLQHKQQVPAGMQFVRWLRNDKILLRGPHGLVSHPIDGGRDRTFQTPPGWLATVIPGTDVEYLYNKQGKLAIRKGSGPLHTVLKGVNGLRFTAVANDLSIFGGVDDKNRLWIQHGLNGKPEVVDGSVKQVLWGPVSHRALVRESNGKSRVYDGRDQSWIDLGVVLGAQWSPDEKRLLFLEVEGKGAERRAYLSLLTGKTVRKLCPIQRIGELRGAIFSGNEDQAFLQAGLAGRDDVWLMSLSVHLPPEPVVRQPKVLHEHPLIVAH